MKGEVIRMKFNYSWGKTRNDLLAGVTVAAISLPQAMAYALIAGVDPRFGLYSAIGDRYQGQSEATEDCKSD